MTTAAHSYQPRHAERHVSATRVSLLLGNAALWVVMIAGLTMVVGH